MKSSKQKKDRQYYDQQTNRKLKIEQNEPHYKTGVNSGAPDR